MSKTKLQIAPGVWLDARRAIWLEGERVLAVADLHLGYAWAHRHSGNLLPVSAREDTVERLSALVADYAPVELVLLGDIVHRAVHVPVLKDELCRLFAELSARATLRLVAGNHDARLAPLLGACALEAEVLSEVRSGPHLLLHGDTAQQAAEELTAARERGGCIFIGHEHPAIGLSDGVVRSARYPCFLVAPELVVLPAFSRWSAGTEVRGRELMSPLGRGVQFARAVAIVAGKLLPVRL